MDARIASYYTEEKPTIDKWQLSGYSRNKYRGRDSTTNFGFIDDFYTIIGYDSGSFPIWQSGLRSEHTINSPNTPILKQSL
jgi:hypothetical protein